MTLGDALRELDVPQHRPGFFDELRDELAPHRTGAARSRWLLVAAAVAVAVGALAFGLTRGSNVASAAQVRAAVERALASAGSISGILVHTDTVGPAYRWQFVFSSTGAFRIAEGPHMTLGFDPSTNTGVISEGGVFVRGKGFAPGPPDSEPLGAGFERDLGAVVVALAAAKDPRVAEVTYQGRPAWLLTLRHAVGCCTERRITVDRQTGIPVRDQLLRGGKVTSEWRIEGLRVSAAVKAIAPVEPRPGQTIQSSDAGFRRISTSDARRQAGYAPLVPQYLPGGFRLSTVAFAKSATATGYEGVRNPRSHDVLSFSYRRGLEQIVVTTRRTFSSPADWHDPFSLFTHSGSTPEKVRFTSGALAGKRGYVVLEPDELPHIWTAGPKLVVTVAGTLDRADLLRVANSLHVAG